MFQSIELFQAAVSTELTLHPSFLLFCLQALHQNLENLKPKMRGSKVDRKGREAPVTSTVRESSGAKQVHFAALLPAVLILGKD